MNNLKINIFTPNKKKQIVSFSQNRNYVLLTSSSSDSFSSVTVFKDVDVDGIRLKIVEDIPVEDILGATTNPLLSLKVVTDVIEPAMDDTSSKFLCDISNILHCFLYTSHSSGKPF